MTSPCLKQSGDAVQSRGTIHPVKKGAELGCLSTATEVGHDPDLDYTIGTPVGS